MTRVATLGLSVLAASAIIAGPAGAAPTAGSSADQYGAQANAESLTISIAGTQLTGSKAVANLNNDPSSAAEATMILTPAFAPDPLKATATAADPSDIQAPETCPGNELEAIPAIGRLDVTCPSVAAKVDGGLPYARALGAQLVLEPSVSNVLDTLGLQDTVTGTTDQVFEQVIDPLVQALTGTPLEQIAGDTVQTVQDVINDTLTLKSTARVVVAPALAEVTSAADTVTATAHSQGIRIELLPVDDAGATNGLLPDDLVPGKPLVTITVGDARATSTYNRVTGQKGKPEASASAVTIELGSTILADNLGVPTKIEVAPGVEQCVLTGTPLETCVTVATAGVDADGNPFATSTSIALFKGLNGGIDLATGGVTSGSAGQLPPVVAAAPDLPRTGGNPNIAIIGGGLLALAVLVRRVLIGRS